MRIVNDSFEPEYDELEEDFRYIRVPPPIVTAMWWLARIIAFLFGLSLAPLGMILHLQISAWMST